VMSVLTLADLVTPERIVPSMRAARKREVVQALARLVGDETGPDEKHARDAVLARGDLTSFGIGRGLAIPHATVPGLPQPLGVFARLETPVDFGAADSRPADLVMLVLAPEGQDTMLLRALSCAARRLRDPEVAEKLRGATSAEAAHVILTSDAWRGRDLVPDRKLAA
jgi:nitrogen PTS system EIIA component